MGQYQSRELLPDTINGTVYDERAGKAFMEELTIWMKQSKLEFASKALKAFMVFPAFILQKPSATSKSKEHSAAIERILSLWRQGNLDLLLKEVRFIQSSKASL